MGKDWTNDRRCHPCPNCGNPTVAAGDGVCKPCMRTTGILRERALRHWGEGGVFAESARQIRARIDGDLARLNSRRRQPRRQPQNQ